VYVADWRNDRVQRFDPDGRYLASYGRPGRGVGELHRPAGVAVDEAGRLYVADWGNHRVQVLGPDGAVLAVLHGESGLSKWAEDYFIANPDELEERRKADLEPPLDEAALADPRDRSASIEKLFWGPTAVKLASGGHLLVVDSCRHRIQVYRRTSP
jgi:hypothetical protein